MPTPAERIKRSDSASYDAVAPAFDRFARRYARDEARRLVELARLAPGDRVLDVGTGTGLVARLAAERVGPSGRVVGLDHSLGMLAVALAPTPLAGGAPAGLCAGDAESLGFDDARFDAVVSLYALLHFPDPRRALREMLRVTRPGGRIALAVGSRPPLLSGAGAAYLARRLPLAVRRAMGRCRVAPGLLETLLRERPGAPPSPDGPTATRPVGPRELVRMFQAAGFAAVGWGWEAPVAVVDTVDEFWELQATLSTAARRRLQELADDEIAELRRKFDRACRATLDRGGALVYPSTAFFVSGRRPAD